MFYAVPPGGLVSGQRQSGSVAQRQRCPSECSLCAQVSTWRCAAPSSSSDPAGSASTLDHSVHHCPAAAADVERMNPRGEPDLGKVGLVAAQDEAWVCSCSAPVVDAVVGDPAAVEAGGDVARQGHLGHRAATQIAGVEDVQGLALQPGIPLAAANSVTSSAAGPIRRWRCRWRVAAPAAADRAGPRPTRPGAPAAACGPCRAAASGGRRGSGRPSPATRPAA